MLETKNQISDELLKQFKEYKKIKKKCSAFLVLGFLYRFLDFFHIKR